MSASPIAFAVLALFLWTSHADAQAGDKAFGEYLSSECVTCHQISGKAVGGIPPIIGWPIDQFLAVMNAYKNKDRDNNVMQVIAGKLKEDELAALAAYFGSLKKK
jgi:cytochrome c553